MSIPTDAEFIGFKEVAALLGLSTRTVRRLTAARKLPTPARLTRKTILWSKAALLAWMGGRAGKGDAA